jgi:hypothetical protein
MVTNKIKYISTCLLRISKNDVLFYFNYHVFLEFFLFTGLHRLVAVSYLLSYQIESIVISTKSYLQSSLDKRPTAIRL